MADSAPFDDPKRIAINRVYTGKGDEGFTSLVGGQRVPKGDVRIEAYGELDELNSYVGAARQTLVEIDGPSDRLAEIAQALLRIQHQLFNLGSLLATLPEDVHPRQPRIRAEDSAWLEELMDRCNARLEPLRTFVLPGGHRANTDLHICRTVTRRVERRVVALAAETEVDSEAVRYLNRLSDAFFVLSRAVVLELDATEAYWQPNAATGAAQ